MGVIQKFIVFIVLIVAWLFQYRDRLQKTLDIVYDRLRQVPECEKWCESDGIFITFNKEEKTHCKDKCYRFAYLPPIMKSVCQIGCKPLDFFMNQKCIKSDFCIYYLQVSDLDVKEGVRTRWLHALTRRVFSK
jgi:hypothetical protein